MKPIQIHPLSLLLGAAALGAVLLGTSAMQGVGPPAGNSQVNWRMASPGDIAEFFNYVSFVDLDDGQGGTARTLRFEGINVQIVNGMSSTETANGVGNLIVGYQELGNEVEPDARTGSHYVVVGRRHNYTAYGGLIAGESNSGSGSYACAPGGRRNRAQGSWSSVCGGGYNSATGQGAVVLGGDYNWSGSDGTVVVGGSGNHAIPAGGGGAGNKAVVVGGFDNRSKGQGSVIVGGRYNETTANYSAILAGTSNTCFGDSQGGGSFCAIVGGEGNSTATTTAATVSGGLNRSASGEHDWAAGSLYEND